MSLRIDSSALLTLYFEESDSAHAEHILTAYPGWITARPRALEVRRNLARELTDSDLTAARRQFERDWASTAVVDLTAEVCEAAAEVAELTGAGSLG